MTRQVQCECGQPATVRRLGTTVCARCARLDRPYQNNPKKVGTYDPDQYSLGAHNRRNLETCRIAFGDMGPICGASLAVLEEMLKGKTV
jgi:hypothetical protein